MLRRVRSIHVPLNGERVYIRIEEDVDLSLCEGREPLKVRCDGPNGLKAGSVVGMLQQLGFSAEEILSLRQEGVLQPIDFNQIGAPWEPFDPTLYEEEPEPPAKPANSSAESTNSSLAEELSQPLEATLEELTNLDNVPPEQALEAAERVQRRLEWEMLKEQSRAEIAWLLDNLEKANNAARCVHIKPDGSACRAPAIKGESFCHWHTQTRGLSRETKETAEAQMPVLEDRVGIQLGIMRICHLLTSKAIDPYTARVLFQGLRLAERTLNKEDFLPPGPDLWKAAELAGRKHTHEQD